MSSHKRLAGKTGWMLCSLILVQVHSSFGQPPSTVKVEVSSVEIHASSDFYEPLGSQGEWVVIGSYGRCWKPARIETGWRPYCNGSWQKTDAGWYWASDEPWAWATYHYGRWDFSTQNGWYWVPQTQWAPAWVSWHEGGGYIGWAPLQPLAGISAGGSVEVNAALVTHERYVFVEERHFLEPVRPATVVVDNPVILHKTVSISKVVNERVTNEGPSTEVIEKASGKKILAFPAHELRTREEAAVIAQRKANDATTERVAQSVQSAATHRGDKAVPSHVPAQQKQPPGKAVQGRAEKKASTNEKAVPNPELNLENKIKP